DQPRAGPLQAAQQIQPEFAAQDQLPGGLDHLLQGYEGMGVCLAQSGHVLPDRQQEDRHQPALQMEKAAGFPRPPGSISTHVVFSAIRPRNSSLSSSRKPLSRAKPMIPVTKTPTITMSRRIICRASSIIWPMPLSAASSSTATSTSQERPRAMRMPVSSGETAAGNTSRNQRSRRFRRYRCPTSRYWVGMPLTPSQAATATGKKVALTMMTT